MTTKKTDKTTPNADGSVTIELTKGITVAGAMVHSLRMREPTVGDQLASDRAGGSDADKELAMMANLCQVAPADLHGLSLRDYKRVQGVFLGFLD